MTDLRIIARTLDEPEGDWHTIVLRDAMPVWIGTVIVSRVETECGLLLADERTRVNLSRMDTPPERPTCALCRDHGVPARLAADVREALEAAAGSEA